MNELSPAAEDADAEWSSGECGIMGESGEGDGGFEFDGVRDRERERK